MKNETDGLKTFLAELTAEQKQELINATPQQWVEAITETVTDPGFWQHMGEAFLQGFERGLEKNLNRY
jgi:hypothetical protein